MIYALLVSALLWHGPGESKLTITAGGRVRSFVLYKPLGISAGAPLVIALHGRQDRGDRQTVVQTWIMDSAGDGTTAICRVYTGMKGTQVVSYRIENAGHTWPGGWQYLPVFMVGKTSRNLDASEVIWEFFRRHMRYP